MFRTCSASETDICARAQKWDGTYHSFSVIQSRWVCWLGSACIAISFKFNGVLFNLYAISFYYYGFRIIIIMACENRRSQHSAVVSGGTLKIHFPHKFTHYIFSNFFRIFMILVAKKILKFFRALLTHPFCDEWWRRCKRKLYGKTERVKLEFLEIPSL